MGGETDRQGALVLCMRMRGRCADARPGLEVCGWSGYRNVSWSVSACVCPSQAWTLNFNMGAGVLWG